MYIKRTYIHRCVLKTVLMQRATESRWYFISFKRMIRAQKCGYLFGTRLARLACIEQRRQLFGPASKPSLMLRHPVAFYKIPRRPSTRRWWTIEPFKRAECAKKSHSIRLMLMAILITIWCFVRFRLRLCAKLTRRKRGNFAFVMMMAILRRLRGRKAT